MKLVENSVVVSLTESELITIKLALKASALNYERSIKDAAAAGFLGDLSDSDSPLFDIRCNAAHLDKIKTLLSDLSDIM